jgi:glycosyltransferase involved in cell wall biosynthesis
MKIIHICSPEVRLSRSFGGTESLVYNLAQKQADEGHNVSIITSRYSPDNNLKHYAFVNPTKTSSSWPLTWMTYRLNGFKHVLKSFCWIDKKIDIIHNHLSEEGIGLSFLRKIPCLNTLHGAAHQDLVKSSIIRLYSLTRDTKLVTVSYRSYLQHKQFYGKDLIGFVHSGVRTDYFTYFNKVKSIFDYNLCFLGRISPDKNLDYVISVCDKLKNNGNDINLNIIGKYDSANYNYYKRILELSQERKYINLYVNIKRDKIKPIVGKSDCLIFPTSKTEPLALAPLEVMSTGTPVISFKNTVAEEYVINGENGFLCSNLDEMVDSIIKSKSIDRKKCRELIVKNFSVDTMYRGYMEKYEKVIELAQ